MRLLRAQGLRMIDQTMIFDAVLQQRQLLRETHKPTVSQRKARERQDHASGGRHGNRGRIFGQDEPSAIEASQDMDYSRLQPFEIEDWSDE
jgi:hypothetical protein